MQGGAAIWSLVTESSGQKKAYASRGNLLVVVDSKQRWFMKHFGVPADKVICDSWAILTSGSEDHYDHQLVFYKLEPIEGVERILETVDRPLPELRRRSLVRSMYQNDPDCWRKYVLSTHFPGMTIKEFNVGEQNKDKKMFYLDSDGVFARIVRIWQ
ncbi:hypothetical protein SPFM8_00022 [Salmonella phage SPFM8]|nr:hypothetical protein SPFM8_00022 [Salmonella phage SPFM8]